MHRQVITTSDRPDLDEQSQRALLARWPGAERAGMAFPETGPHVVLVAIDAEADHGYYAETSLWMWHALRADR